MKFLAVAAAAASVAAVASAQLAINDPTGPTVWTTGGQGYILWTGNCAVMGNASHAVDIQLVNGPATSVAYVADLGTLDCSGNVTSIMVTIPATQATGTAIVSGAYSIRILTLPTNSYSESFTVNNAAAPATSAAAATTSASAPAATTAAASAGNSLVANSLLALVGCAAAVFQLVL